MIKSLGPGLDSLDFLRIALGNQHLFIVIQNSNLSKPLVLTWPQLLQQIQAQLNINANNGINVQDEGSVIQSAAQFLNFIGGGVTVTPSATGVDIVIPGGGSAAEWGSIGAGTGVGSQADLVAYLTSNYQPIGNYVPTSRNLTINGVTYDLSADRSWTITSGVYTADNGLTMLSNNVALGSASSPGAPLLNDRYIDTGATYTLNLKGQKTNQSDVILLVDNTASGGTAIKAQGTGSSVAISASSGSSYAIIATSNTLVGLYAQTSATGQGAVLAEVLSSASNLIALGLKIRHSTSGTPVAGFGISTDFRGGTNGFAERSFGRLMYQWTDAVDASRTSKFQLETVDSGTPSVNLEVLGSGQLILNKYTTGTSFGSGLTSVGVLNVDNTGKVFVTGSTITVNNGLTQDPLNANNFQLGGDLLKSTVITAGNISANNRLEINAPANTSSTGSFTVLGLNPGGTYTSPNNILVNFQSNDIITAFFRTGSAYGGAGTGLYIQSTNALCTPIVIYGSGATGSGEIFKVTDNGQLIMEEYRTSTSFQGSSGTSVGILNVDNAGKVFVGAGGGVPTSRQVATTNSLTGGGDLSADRTLQLVNDQASPGANKVYGTDGSGTRGWKNDPTGGGGILHATASGTNTYTASVTPTATSYNDGDAYLIRFTNGNDQSAPTLNIDSLGGKVLYRNNDGELLGGDIHDGAEMLCVYNPLLNGGVGAFQCIGTSPNSLFAYVTNVDTVAITKGMPVVAWGGTGDRMTVQRAYNLDDAHSAQTVGLVFSNSIGVNQKGFIMIQGLLDGLNIVPTPTWSDGDPVYLGATAGTITKTKPYAPNHLVYLGFVTTANPGNAGRIYVKVQNGYELDELHNVQAQSPNLNDTLYYDNTVSPAQWKTTSVNSLLNTSVKTGSCGVTFDGGGQVIQNKTAYVQMPYNGTLGAWSMVADQAGACTISVSKGTFGTFPPTSAVYSTQPAIPATNITATNAGAYNPGMATVTAGDVLKFDISGVATITWVNLSISITKT